MNQTVTEDVVLKNLLGLYTPSSILYYTSTPAYELFVRSESLI